MWRYLLLDDNVQFIWISFRNVVKCAPSTEQFHFQFFLRCDPSSSIVWSEGRLQLRPEQNHHLRQFENRALPWPLCRKTTIHDLFSPGYIRVGSRVWGKALNGDFYKGVVTGLGQMIHIKFDNGDTIAHDRNDPECVVFDQDPDATEIQIGMLS